MHITANKVSLS